MLPLPAPTWELITLAVRSTDFFADALEQKQFLKELLQISGSHLCLESHLPGTAGFHRFVDPEMLEFTSHRSYPWALYIMQDSLTPDVVWSNKTSDKGVEIDFYRSACVLFDPSIKVGEILLMGRIAIGNKHLYEEKGIDFRQVCHLYDEVKNAARRTLYYQSAWAVAATGERGLYKNIWVSRGAASCSARGSVLKQVITGTITFVAADSAKT